MKRRNVFSVNLSDKSIAILMRIGVFNKKRRPSQTNDVSFSVFMNDLIEEKALQLSETGGPDFEINLWKQKLSKMQLERDTMLTSYDKKIRKVVTIIRKLKDDR